MTGMPAFVIFKIDSTTSSPPSNFTAWAPVSFMILTAEAKAMELSD